MKKRPKERDNGKNEEENMKRALVIGCPGSGKSTFSRELHKRTGLALYHLDMMYWKEDGARVGRELFLQSLYDTLEKDEWIIDGNYQSTLPLRLDACDTVFFLDYPTSVCLDGIRERIGKRRDDIPWVEKEESEELVALVEGFRSSARPEIIKLLSQARDKRVVIFTSREEASAYLSGEENLL